MSSVDLSYPYPSPPSLPVPVTSPSHSTSAPSSPGPSVLLGLLWNFRGLATMWAAPRRLVNYPGHDGPGLLFGSPPPP